MKNSFSGLIIGQYTAEEKSSELEDFLIEIIQVETQGENGGEGGEIMESSQSRQEPHSVASRHPSCGHMSKSPISTKQDDQDLLLLLHDGPAWVCP